MCFTVFGKSPHRALIHDDPNPPFSPLYQVGTNHHLPTPPSSLHALFLLPPPCSPLFTWQHCSSSRGAARPHAQIASVEEEHEVRMDLARARWHAETDAAVERAAAAQQVRGSPGLHACSLCT